MMKIDLFFVSSWTPLWVFVKSQLSKIIMQHSGWKWPPGTVRLLLLYIKQRLGCLDRNKKRDTDSEQTVNKRHTLPVPDSAEGDDSCRERRWDRVRIHKENLRESIMPTKENNNINKTSS